MGQPSTIDCLIGRTNDREVQLRESLYFDPDGKRIVLREPE